MPSKASDQPVVVQVLNSVLLVVAAPTAQLCGGKEAEAAILFLAAPSVSAILLLCQDSIVDHRLKLDWGSLEWIIGCLWEGCGMIT